MSPGWELQNTDFWEDSRGISHVHAVDENILWAAAYDGTDPLGPCIDFTRTANGGELWEADTIFGGPEEGSLAMIFALDENTAWVPIHSGTPQGIWKTSDGGDSWVHQDTAAFSGAGAFPNIVHFWNENDGWCQGDPVDGYYEMYTTDDGGDTWVRVPEENIPPPLEPVEYGVVGYYDVVGDTVWWGTTYGDPLRVFKSTDRGLHWTVAEVPFESGAYVDVRFKDENNGIAMDKGADRWPTPIAETSDGGETWTLIEYTGKCYGYDFEYVPGTYNMYVSTGVNVNVEAQRGGSYSYDGGHSWTVWEEMEGVQLIATAWVEGAIGWAGGFHHLDEDDGMNKYTPIPGGEPNLECKGELSWTGVDPGATVDGEFDVCNYGEIGSLLNWSLESTPEWGVWEIEPDSGSDLIAGNCVTIQVTVTAPDDPDKEFIGKVKVTNSDDPSDYCEIDVSLRTPRARSLHNTLFLQFLQQFPNVFPILRHILGL